MATTGAKPCGSVTATLGTWTVLSVATLASNDRSGTTNASYNPCTRNTNFEYEAGNFGFDAAIPVGSTIDSVVITYEQAYSASTTSTTTVTPYVGGSAVGSGQQQTATPTSDTPYTYDVTSLRSPWTRADLLDGTFTVRHRVRRTATGTLNFFVDYVWVTVTYTQHYAPNAPVSAAASNITETGFSANWAASVVDGTHEAATTYHLDVATDSLFSNILVSYSDLDVGNVTTYPVTGLTGNTPYWYRVRGVNATGESTSSGSQTLTTSPPPDPPNAPNSAPSTLHTTGSFQANWAAPTGGTTPTGYRLDVSTDPGFGAGTFVGVYNDYDVGNVLLRSVSGLSAGGTYYYRVRAYSGAGSGTSSGTVTAWTTLTASDGSTDDVYDFEAGLSTLHGSTVGAACITATSPLAGTYSASAPHPVADVDSGLHILPKSNPDYIKVTWKGRIDVLSTEVPYLAFLAGPSYSVFELYANQSDSRFHIYYYNTSHVYANEWTDTDDTVTQGTTYTFAVEYIPASSQVKFWVDGNLRGTFTDVCTDAAIDHFDVGVFASSSTTQRATIDDITISYTNPSGPISGSLTSTLQGATVSGSGQVVIAGAATVSSLQGATLSGSGTLGPAPTFTPKQGAWRWYTDASPDGSMTALAAQGATPTLTGSHMQNGIVRLRVAIDETGGTGGTTGALQLEYSGDGTNWQALATGASSAQGRWFRNANGACSDGATLGALLLTGSTASGKYHEGATATETIAGSAIQEIDFPVLVHWPPPDVSGIQFRLTSGGTPLPLDGAASYPSLNTCAAADRPYTISYLDPNPASTSEPQTLYDAQTRRLFYDGTNWWLFYSEYGTSNTICARYWTGSGGWSAKQTTVIGSSSARGIRNQHALKVIGGTPVVMSVCFSSSSTAYKRGTISGTTLSYGAGENPTIASPSYGAVCIDDGNYWWLVAAQPASNVVSAKRSTNADTGSGWTTGWQAAKTVAETGFGGYGFMSAVPLGSDKVLVLWHTYQSPGDSQLRAAVCSDSGGFGAVTNVTTLGGAASASNYNDWGVVRSGDYVYVAHTNQSAYGGAWRLAVYKISTNTWYRGPNPNLAATTGSADQAPVTYDAGNNKLYLFCTANGPEGGEDRIIEYETYSGPGEAGTWDNNVATVSPGGRLNMDAISATADASGGKIVLAATVCDDSMLGTGFALEYHTVTVSAGSRTGSLSATLGAATATASGKVGLVGALTATLGAATAAASGALRIAGTAARTLLASGVSAAGKVGIKGALSLTLAAASVSGGGQLATHGLATATLGASGLSASGQVALRGSSTTTLSAATLSATGQGAVNGTGSLSVTLQSATASGSGKVDIRGSGAATLQSATTSGNGRLDVKGSATSTLQGATLTGTGSLQSSLANIIFMEPGGSHTFDLKPWSSTVGTVTVDSAVTNGQPRSIKLDSGGTNQPAYVTRNQTLADTGRRMSFYVYFATLPTADTTLWDARVNGGGTSVYSLQYVAASHKLRLVGNASTSLGGTVLSAGKWYRIGLAHKIVNASTNDMQLWLTDSGTTTNEATLHNVSLAVANTYVFWLGLVTAPGANVVAYLSDVYLDDGSTVSDIGDVHVTAKLPSGVADVTTAFDLQVGSFTNRWDGVSERPESASKGWTKSTDTGTAQELYVVQGPSQGDVDISGASLLGYAGWAWGVLGGGGTTPTFALTTNGADAAFTFAPGAGSYRATYVGSATYPTNTAQVAAVGVKVTAAGTTDFTLAECGIIVAYIPGAPPSGRTGSLSTTLAPATCSGTGLLALQGQASRTLAPSGVVGAGSLAIKGQAPAASYAPLGLVAAGRLRIQATGAVTFEDLVAAGTATLGAPPSRTGTLTCTLRAATATASGKLATHGTLTRSLTAAQLSALGQLALKGQLSRTMQAATSTGTGSLATHGSSTTTLRGATLSASGTLTQGASGALNATLQGATVSGAGKVALSAHATATLQAATTSSTVGHVAIRGSASATLGAATVAGTGVVPVRGSATATLQGATVSGQGRVAVRGSVSATVSASGLVGTATTNRHGSVSATLSPATVSAAGLLATHATLNRTLSASTLSANGGHGASGSLNATLMPATGTASGKVGTHGSASVTLQSATVTSSSGKLTNSGHAAVTPLGATSAGTAQGALAIKGQVPAQTLRPATLTAHGGAQAGGNLSVTLGASIVAASGRLEVHAAASQTLRSATAAASARLTNSGHATVTLQGATPMGVGHLEIVGQVSAWLASSGLQGTGYHYVPPALGSARVSDRAVGQVVSGNRAIGSVRITDE